MDLTLAIIVTVVGASTPILIAALGELVVERSGVLNLGVEGMMLIGAIAGFVVQFHTGNPYLALLVSGALAGLAGVLEVAGPFQRMVPGFPTNYGFTAIIVAFLGRLNPLGVIVAGVVLAITFVGGEVAQTTIGLPNAATGIFQAMMLFFLLAGDILIKYRVRRVVPQASAGVA